MRMKAFNLARIDKEHDMHLQAWLNHAVTSTKEKNKKTVPVYKTFDEFFDYKKRLSEVEGKKNSRLTPQQKKMAQIAAKVNEGR